MSATAAFGALAPSAPSRDPTFWVLVIPRPTTRRPVEAEQPAMPNGEEQNCLESLIREDFERCHPGDSFEDLKRRASFSKEDKGLLRDWMAIARARAAADRAKASAPNPAATRA
jgi:hypothetical protein